MVKSAEKIKHQIAAIPALISTPLSVPHAVIFEESVANSWVESKKVRLKGLFLKFINVKYPHAGKA